MSRSILLADDSVTIQKIVELAFVQNGYEVHAVGGGDEAIAQLEKSEPTVVITDVHMPGASGYDVCKASKERYSGVPVVLLIGAFESFDPADVESCGADASLKKPFDSKDLVTMVDELVDRASSGSPSDSPSDSAESATEAAGPEASTESSPIVADSPDVSVAGPGLQSADASDSDAGSSSDGPSDSASDVSGSGLSDADVDRIARRVAEILGENEVREVAWEVIPDLAEIVIKDRLRELESQVE